MKMPPIFEQDGRLPTLLATDHREAAIVKSLNTTVVAGLAF